MKALLFLEKKKQKNLNPLATVFEVGTESHGLKFFGSFFQKRTTSFP
jgi:hypothetical protein